MSEERLNSLLSAWQEQQLQGRDVPAGELCRDCPELTEELSRRIRALRRKNNLAQPASATPRPGAAASASDAETCYRPTGFEANDCRETAWRPEPTRPGPGLVAGPVPGYEILGELGRGGMGVVYKARQISLKRVVALKTILGGRHAGADQRTRFRAEAEAAARLQHPNIVQVHEIGAYGGHPYFSMEYVEGASLAQHLTRRLLPAPEAAALVARLADAIHFAHQQGIVHRDLKPANVLLSLVPGPLSLAEDKGPGTADPGPIPKITDFGLAKQLQGDSGLTQSGAILGTPSYMAPEQAAGQGKGIGPAADIHALGAILYEALTGRPPFHGATVMDTLYQVREMEPVPPSRLQAQVPRDLEVICLKCLRKEPARRYATAGELVEDLRRFLAGESIRARPAGAPERAWRWCRRKPVVAGLLAALALSLLGGVAGVLHFALRAAASAREARANAEGLRRGLVRQNIAAGTYLLETDKRASGAWSYARAWELDAADHDAEGEHRLRVGFALQDGPQLVGVCFHERPVLDAVFDPAGKTVLTRTDEPRAYLWDPFASRLTTPPLEHEGAVRAATFSPSGEQVATGSVDGKVRLWDTRSGGLLLTLPPGGPVNAVAYRPDGGLLAAADEAGAVRFWDPQTGRPGAPALELSAAVYHVAFSPDGRRVVTADAAHVTRVWEVAGGSAVTKALPHQDRRADDEFALSYHCWPVFSPDGSTLVTVHPNNKQHAEITAWDLATGKPRYPHIDSGYFVHQVVYNRAGDRLLVLVGNAGNVYEAASGRRLKVLHHPRESQHACFSPDGQVLATCSTGGVVHRWDTRTWQEIDEPLRCADGVQSLTFSPAGQRLLAASYDGTARVWRPAAGRLRAYAYDCGHADRLVVRRDKDLVRASPDGRREVRSGPAGTRLGDQGGGGPELKLTHPAAVTRNRFSADGRRLLTQDARGTVRWWDTATGQPAAPSVSLAAQLSDLEISGDGRRLLTVEKGPAGTAEHAVTVWDVDSGRSLFGPLREWDTGPQRFGERALHRHVSKAALSPDGTRLVLGSDATGVLGVWDVDAGRELGRTAGYRGVLYQIRFTADGRRFLTNGSDTVARLWHTATVEPAGPPLRHARFCRGADVGPDGWRVVTVASDAVVRLWDGRTGDLLGRVALSPTSEELVWFSHDGRRLVVNGGRQVLDLPSYDGDPAALPALLRLLTGLQRDPDDSIGPVDPQTFLRDPEPYRRAWHAWHGRSDDPLEQAIKVAFTNRTDQRVTFALVGEKVSEARLEPGQSRTYTMAVEAGVQPAVKINQPAGESLSFAVADGGKYAFRYKDGQVHNFFD
jgi:WD40 repeat protein